MRIKNTNAILSFFKQYSAKRITTFFICSNLCMVLVSLVNFYTSRYSKTLHPSNNSLEMDIQRAIITVNQHNLMIRDTTLDRLKNTFLSQGNETKVLQIVTNKKSIPASLTADINTCQKILGKNCQIYEKNGKFKFASNKNKKQAFKYNQGFYDYNGVRLDKREEMLKPMQIVTPASNKKLRVSSGYGPRLHPVTKVWSFHAGIDVASGKNSLVHAALDGVVKLIAYNNIYGNYIILQHRNNIETLYAHLESISSGMYLGKHIKQKEIIGKIGKTGRATGYHLHFETRVNGAHVNPNSIKPMQYTLSPDQLSVFRRHCTHLINEAKILGIAS